ncbi:LysR family substrate-binding domain-containing protein [Lentzea sp. E54]|uniref:LysR family substrate-binding domain-containing protein n=1 Tax=Lentzea xerophila TaxID=3435883 RepID=UPI003DA25070
MTLTVAGRQLLDDAGPLLASAHAVRRRVSVAGRAGRRLVVGFRAGIPVIPATRVFEARHPDVVVDVQRMEWDDQAPMLVDGRVDVGYVRLPIDEAGLRLTPLYTEPLMVVLPADHRLAGKDEVIEAELAGEPLIWHADASTQPTRRPHPASGLRVRGVEEKLEHVAAGRGISFVGRSETVFFSRPDISYVPVPDLAPDQIFVAMAASRTSPLADDFFAAAQATAEITAECGNYEMWQRAADTAAKRG